MKAQHTTKLAKKTVFVYRSIKAQSNNYATHPVTDQGQTIIMTATVSDLIGF